MFKRKVSNLKDRERTWQNGEGVKESAYLMKGMCR